MLFADRESADRAVRELNGTELDGRKIFLRKVWVSLVEDYSPLSPSLFLSALSSCVLCIVWLVFEGMLQQMI